MVYEKKILEKNSIQFNYIYRNLKNKYNFINVNQQKNTLDIIFIAMIKRSF